MARVLCPFCLTPHDFDKSLECTKYNHEVPSVYIKDYRKVPPMWLATVGFSRHGKTTYLAALTMMLEEIPKVIDRMYYRPLDQYSADEIRTWRQEMREGKLAEANPVGVSRPILFNVYDLPNAGSRCLVMYDVAGEIYNDLNAVAEYLPSLKQVNTTWFLVSLKDLQEDGEERSITELFNSYLSGMERMRANLQGRNLIVVYTKADALKLAKISPFKEYYQADPFQALTSADADLSTFDQFSLDDYVNEMEHISDKLRDYTRRRVRGGAAFIRQVEQSGMNLVFSLTSALGEDPDKSGHLAAEAIRYRVLDPFFWAITLERKTSSRELGLVLDASADSPSIYDGNFLPELWDMLSDQGELTTYQLGRLKIVSKPGQEPPKKTPRVPCHRLIGPVLEKLPADSYLVVLSTGRILDLSDFSRTHWRDQILLISMGDDELQSWSHTLAYREDDDPSIIVDSLMRLQETDHADI